MASLGRQRFTPQLRKNDRLKITETISYFGGSHSVKAGLDFNHVDNEAALPLHFGGRYIFSSLPAPITTIEAVALAARGESPWT